MVERHVNMEDANVRLADLIDKCAHGAEVVISRNGMPVARLIPDDTHKPEHRAKEPRRGVKIAPEFDAADVRTARLLDEGDVPWRLRELPRN